jgi:hypothetical protein
MEDRILTSVGTGPGGQNLGITEEEEGGEGGKGEDEGDEEDEDDEMMM